MTNKILDSLSETLMWDDHILSVRERELIVRLLQCDKSQGDARTAVNDTVARVVGEIVAQRAYGALGESIVRHLTADSFHSNTPHESLGTRRSAIAGLRPRTMFQSGPNPMGPFPPTPGPSPHPPGPSGPGCKEKPGGWQTHSESVAVLDLPAECAVLEEFLAPSELDALLQYALSQESSFTFSEVISPGATGGFVDHEHRRSRILTDLGKHHAVIVDRLEASWPRILLKLAHDSFQPSRVEAQITASNDGDFFREHTDNGADEIARRQITFVYFFHREPKAFQGGELRIYDSRFENGGYVPAEDYRTVIPQQNQMVLFASSLTHEITPVECPSKAFADSRFTVNGWFHR